MLGGGRRPALLWLGALLALPAGFCCAPAARASCGDYVVLDRSLAVRHAGQPQAPVTPPRNAPCPGPLCSGGSQPLPAPVTTAPTAPEQWGTVAEPAPGPASERSAAFAAPPQRRLRGFASSVFHPPRTSSAACHRS
jgi:hypothetical protein